MPTMIILPLIILTFLHLQSVLSTSNHSLIFGYSIRGDDDNEKYQNSLYNNFLGTLSSPTSNTGFGNFSTSFPKTRNQLHGLYLCRGDVDRQTCEGCVNFAIKTILQDYPNGREALVWYNHCMVRYSNESFYGKWDKNMWYSAGDINKIRSTYIRFMIILRATMKDLAIQASKGQNDGNKFASKVVNYTRFESLHAMAQCTPDLVASDCYMCLINANRKLFDRHGSTSGKAFYRSCMVQYKTTNAFDNDNVNSLPFDNSTLIKLRVQVVTIPFSNNSSPTEAISNSTRTFYKVRFDRFPISNKTVDSSSTSPGRYEAKGTLPDDADSRNHSKDWATI